MIDARWRESASVLHNLQRLSTLANAADDIFCGENDLNHQNEVQHHERLSKSLMELMNPSTISKRVARGRAEAPAVSPKSFS